MSSFRQARFEPRLAYVVSQYPAPSHAFILREVLALRTHGLNVVTFSARAGISLSSADEQELASTVVLQRGGLLQHVAAHVATLMRSPRAYLSALTAGVTPKSGARRLIWQLAYFLQGVRLYDACRRAGVKHLHAHFANNAVDIVRVAAQLSDGWTWSFTMHGPTEFADLTKYGLAQKALDADMVICISDYARSQLMALLPPERWKHLIVVHCGVPTHDWPQRSAKLHDKASQVRVLCVGRLVPKKGQAILFEACAMLTKSGVPYHLTLVGDGPSRQALLQLAKRMGIQENVTFAGAVGQDQIQAHFERADVFCLPSFAEGVPVVLMEAMSIGVPVIATAIAGIPELVHDGVTGLLVTPGRPDLIKDALLKLLNEPELAARLVEAGRHTVETRYDSTVAASGLAGAFRDLIAARHTHREEARHHK